MQKKEKSKERFKLVIAVHLFLIHNDQILLSRRFNTGYRDGEYSVIAGHLDGNETATNAMSREAEEEACIKIDPSKLKMVHVMHRLSTEERLDFFFAAENWEGTPTIMEKNKCDDLRWFPLNHLPENIVPYVRVAIDSFQNNQVYSEFGWIVPDEK